MTEPLSHKHIYYAFRLHPRGKEVQRTLMGKFAIHDGHFQVLEDHDFDHDLHALSPEKACRYIYSLSRGQRSEVVNAEDLRQGHHPHLLPSTGKPRSVPADLRDAIGMQVRDPEPPAIRHSSFDYHRTGMPAPQHLEVHGDQSYLDGQRLPPEELQALMANIQNGRATIRHRLPPGSDLQKIEPKLADALGALRAAVQAGHVHPDHMQAINRQIFADTMLPQMGNKMAYQDFLSRPRPGVHVHLDGNDFGSINKIHDHETGDKAIVAMGRALREAMDEAVGRKHGKLFRTGGDEFVAHVPSAEHAAAFSRTLRTKLDSIPAIRGTHRLSMSVGYGPSREHAETALQDAKAQKKLAAKPLGQAETHVAHRMPEPGQP